MWTHVMKYYPKTRVTWGNRANWLRDNGFKTQALSDYSERIRLAADDPEPFNSRAKLYFQSNSRDTLQLALADYKKAVELAETKNKKHSLKAEYRVNLASTLARLGQYNEAINMFTEAEKIDPNNANVYFNRSITYHNINNIEEEKRDIVKYLKFKPRHSEMIVNLAITKRLLGDFQGAVDDCTRALRFSKLPIIYIERVRNYIALGNYELARKDVQILSKNRIQIPADVLEKLGM
jgi:tetratricopeptide (TPR) repeat protein